jgi:4-hydroxythreonine-4-phosphate dehydrogenase
VKIALTPGEPAGIGPDICIEAAHWTLPAEVVAVADPELLRRRAERLRIPLTIVEYHPGQTVANRPGTLAVLPVRLAREVECGRLDAANAPYVLDALDAAIAGCLGGEFDALVTGPVQKSVINQAGIRFTGHTEYLADAARTPDVVMMLATAGLRVALATTHLALRDVFRALTPERLENTLTTTWAGLRDCFAIESPRLLVCGLNPHAGEDGGLGDEEIEFITPVIRRLAAQGMRLTGPRPADTSFLPEVLAGTDAVVAMYHDQGLPVLKHMGFGEAVNVTLGLPFIRTSVDHGTALELAGSGQARADSLRHALQTAIAMASCRARRRGA